jgi:hypothetical protein
MLIASPPFEALAQATHLDIKLSGFEDAPMVRTNE